MCPPSYEKNTNENCWNQDAQKEFPNKLDFSDFTNVTQADVKKFEGAEFDAKDCSLRHGAVVMERAEARKEKEKMEKTKKLVKELKKRISAVENEYGITEPVANEEHQDDQE